jgi:hypothetical protein
VDDGEPGIEVAMSTLDEQLVDESAPVSMLKIDAEGHDLDVLRGALAAIERLRPVILVEIWTGGAGALNLVQGMGYRRYSYNPASRSLVEVPAGQRQAGNSLLVPDVKIDAVSRRLQSAERPVLRAPSVRWLGLPRARASRA